MLQLLIKSRIFPLNMPLNMHRKNFLSYVSKKMNPTNVQIDSPNSDKTHFYKLPYVGWFSKIAQTKLRKLLKRYCKADLDVKLVFSTFKLRNMFACCSRVVYKFSCAGCNASYSGETTRHICARVREHLLSDKSSHVYRHLQSSRACHNSCTTECFTILDSAVSKFQIKIKEAMHIKWENPTRNQQLKHLELSLSF